MLTQHGGARHSGLEGQSSSTTRGRFVLVACALPLRCMAPLTDHTVDGDTLTDIYQSFFCSEVQKRSIQVQFCSVLCDTITDKDTLLNCGGIILPMGPMSLYVTFASSMDDTIRTSLPREVRLALQSHKSLFYQGDLLMSV